MPIYEYQCTDCHHQFDALQKMSDEPIRKCPKCSKNKVVRLVSAAGFQLKGSGWYATDFKNKNQPENKPIKESTAATESSAGEKTTKEQPAVATSSTTKKGEAD